MPTVERHVALPTDLAAAWDLLVDPLQQTGWLGREVDLVAVPGRGGSVVDHDGTHRRLVVDEVEVGRRISFTWWPAEGDGPASQVHVTLDPIDDGTRVTVVEQLDAGATSSTRASAAGRGARWSLALFHLELLVALVAPVRV